MSNVPTFTMGELFSDGSRYVIPVYQRNYAWGEKEITQLVQDVFDYASDPTKVDNDYYIGTLVVYERQMDNEISYETIDGQQRLTTLCLMLSALHREFNNTLTDRIDYKFSLAFDSRKKSTETINVISKLSDKLEYLSTKDYNVNIQQGYEFALKAMKKLLTKDSDIKLFYSYLTQKVRVVRVAVPEKTDLNHYFEIMNNRGEQLEKHEILKAKLLEIVRDDKGLSYTFKTIWGACSDMERYVQYGFSIEQRHDLFGSKYWAELKVKSIDEVIDKIYKANSDLSEEANHLSIEQIISSQQNFETNEDHVEDAPERFSSVINFPNFLLHVLRIYTAENISLDDKRLLSIFDECIDNFETPKEQQDFVKAFGFALLKTKFLFDHNIIKREFIREKDQWSLKRLKWYKDNKVSYVNRFGEESTDNKSILMLLAMFHVSTSTMVYKHWLNGALNYLYSATELTSRSYKNYLENMAQSFLFDRLLKKGEPLDFYDIIYRNNGKSKFYSKNHEDHAFENLDKGTSVENFIFNYLDYILWTKDKTVRFEFTFRSSVEHYYPQNPIAAHLISATVCDMFGNLCLISSSKNSKLSNLLPSGKKDFYRDSKVPVDSLKQKSMMDKTTWGETEIKEESEKMKMTLLKHSYAK